MYGGKIMGKEAIKGDDSRIMKGVWEMMNEADVIIWHNGDKFDYRKLNTRFLIHGMNPVLPFISIDTLKHSRRMFSHSSNKLDDLNGDLKLRQKVEHEGFPLWKACDNGDNKAIKRMFDYNTGDIFAEEDLYLRIRQWIKPHPNLSLHITDEKVERCPTCLSDDLKAERKGYFTKTARYETFRCNSCGATGRHRTGVLSKDRSHYIKVSV
jgi:DNA polymerase III epsilon subunit-like protein